MAKQKNLGQCHVMSNQRAAQILALLQREYPAVETPLAHTSVWELLVATILSAQCTDARVNMVTPQLFARYPNVHEVANAQVAQLEQIIHSIGFFRAKARNIIACAERIIDVYDGDVPGKMEELITLPGVGRKTANVVLARWFHVPGLVVDTHVIRLSRLLALTKNTDPEKIERDLQPLFPPQEWSDLSLRLIFHGRRVCVARTPRCAACILASLCPSRRDIPKP